MMMEFRCVRKDGVVNVLRLDGAEAEFESFDSDFANARWPNKIRLNVAELSPRKVFDLLEVEKGQHFNIISDDVYAMFSDVNDFKRSVWGTLRRIKKSG